VLANPWFLSIKAGLACLIALLLDRATGNPDHLSATFVAVLCASPTVLAGVRRAWVQLLGSALGGIVGALLWAGGAPPLVAVPLGVTLSIGAAFAVRAPLGYPVAAFSALTVVLIPRGGPLETLEIRLLAVVIAAASGFLVNLVVSAFFYTRLFERRLWHAEQHVRARLRIAGEGLTALQPAFGVLAALADELALALEELRLRHTDASRARLAAMAGRLEHLRHLLHLACDLHYQLVERGLPAEAAAPMFRWLADPTGPRPPLSPELEPQAARIESALRDLSPD
jgi:uncharacterized membrane protein YccC